MANPMAPMAAYNRIFTSAIRHVRHYSAQAERTIPEAKQKYVPTSGTYPQGFLVGTAHAGVKASNTQYDDVAMIVSETPCVGAALFTRNIFKAAPVSVSNTILRERRANNLRGVVINSGCANAVTGKLGLEHATTMAKETDKLFEGSDPNSPSTLVMSTGVIGQNLPIDRISAAIPKAHGALGSTHEHWLNGAKAICTTDTFPKLISRTFTLPSNPDIEYKIAGMTKGAGMIHPNMATLLGVICTDAAIDSGSVRRILRMATNSSFNKVSIDGDTSTNDTVALFANGAAAGPDTPFLTMPTTPKKEQSPAEKDGHAFTVVLRSFMEDLAKLVVRDGEGATKFVTIRVKSDVSDIVATSVASSIAQSSLVKTALYGKDANWGRILCAIGYTPYVLAKTAQKEHPVSPKRTSVSFIPSDGSPELKLLVRGEPEAVDEDRAKEILEMEDLEILVRLEDDGPGRSPKKRHYNATFWTCDFSHEYVTINGDYRT